MSLSTKSDRVQFPPCHFVFIEKIGPFEQTAFAAWQELHGCFQSLVDVPNVQGAMALFKMQPVPLYRAGFIVDRPFTKSHQTLLYTVTEQQVYARYVYQGPYDGLGENWGIAMAQAESEAIRPTDAFYIERYINNPQDTTPENLVTELMIPI